MTSSLASPRPSSTVQRDHDVQPTDALRHFEIAPSPHLLVMPNIQYSAVQNGFTPSAFKYSLPASSVRCLTTVN